MCKKETIIQKNSNSNTNYIILKEALTYHTAVGKEFLLSSLVLAVIGLFHLSDSSGYKEGVAEVGCFMMAVRAIKVLRSWQWMIYDLLSYATVEQPIAEAVCMGALYVNIKTDKDTSSLLRMLSFMRILKYLLSLSSLCVGHSHSMSEALST